MAMTNKHVKIRKTNRKIAYPSCARYILSDIAQDVQPLECIPVKLHDDSIRIEAMGFSE
jgi:hypothetical protein